MAEAAEHIAALADIIRRRGPTGMSLGHQTIAWTKQCWRNDATREDAEIIMQAFPREDWR
ncbi:MAG: hypothetical protein QM647_15165 [Asticcacaulis sp.]|uniref:hypothetical protein n=1 Tax=Asticcacaulis sp. TaxID=1872648 RepID=UPI0039E39257